MLGEQDVGRLHVSVNQRLLSRVEMVESGRDSIRDQKSLLTRQHFHSRLSSKSLLQGAVGHVGIDQAQLK